MDADTEAMLSQDTIVTEWSSLEASEGVWSCPHLDFGFLASWTVREQIYVVLSLPVYGILLQEP